jgi:hypothetical protein
MSTCANCRKLVVWSASKCPHCGVAFVPGLWNMQSGTITPRAEAWGIAPEIFHGLPFQVASLLCPIWLPLLVTLAAGPQPGNEWVGLALLLALFVFMPGALVIANYRDWGKLARAFALVVYVAASEVVMFVVLWAVSKHWWA